MQGQTSSQSATSNKQNDDPELRALLKQLVTELAQLRTELRQQRLDQQEITLSRLENELRQLQLERKTLKSRNVDKSPRLRNSMSSYNNRTSILLSVQLLKPPRSKR